MPVIQIQVTIFNHSDYPIVWLDDGRDHGDWQDPWYPSNIKNLKKGESASFRIESDGIATGAEGWALFKVDVPFASNVGDRAEYFTLHFERPFLETTTMRRTVTWARSDPRTDAFPHPGPRMAYGSDIGIRDMGDGSNLGEILGAVAVDLDTAGLGMFAEAPFLLLTDSFPKHVLWVVDIRNAGEGQAAEPLKVPDKGLVYAVTSRQLELGKLGEGDRTVGGDLNWYRHDGRLDGSFRWEGPCKVGNRWDGLEQVFGGGDGIVYGITPRVAVMPPGISATLEHAGGTPAHGGDLLWYRHLGWEDGSFRWDGPKKVGTGWDELEHVFSGGDGVLYGIDANGDLQWYRHVGREDGSFRWEGPKKVGVGWGGLARVFGGGDGVVYAVTGARLSATGGGGQTLGGDLMWYRHLGWQDGSFRWDGPKKVGTGWGGFEHLFADGAGVLYGVTPHVDATLGLTGGPQLPGMGSGPVAIRPIPARGGDLLWFHHTGRETGDWSWQGPSKVGVGWGGQQAMFSGGVLPV